MKYIGHANRNSAVNPNVGAMNPLNALALPKPHPRANPLQTSRKSMDRGLHG